MCLPSDHRVFINHLNTLWRTVKSFDFALLRFKLKLSECLFYGLKTWHSTLSSRFYALKFMLSFKYFVFKQNLSKMFQNNFYRAPFWSRDQLRLIFVFVEILCAHTTLPTTRFMLPLPLSPPHAHAHPHTRTRMSTLARSHTYTKASEQNHNLPLKTNQFMPKKKS